MTHEIEKIDNSFTDNLAFFSFIDETTKEWLNSLNHIWKLWKKCDSVIKMLSEYFEGAPNPYLSTIRILVNTSDFKHMKTSSLAFTVIEEYAKWLEPRKEIYKHFLVLDLKLAVFQLVIMQNNMEFTKMVAVTYDLAEDNKEFLNIIQKIVYEKKYKEAAQYVVMLQLQEHFADPESLLLPLILQNKLTIVEDVLTDCPQMQRIFVKYLDNLVGSDNNMHITLDEIIKKNNIPDVKMSTTQVRPMTKLIARFVKLYNLPPESCPNLNKKRCEGALQFLIHKRYVDGSLSTASWREMVEEAIGNDIKLQLHMLRLLINARDAKEGLYWAKRLNIPKEQWPWAITYEDEQSEFEGINEGASTSRGEVSNVEISEDIINCHELKLSRHCIKIIDNSRSFEEFLNNGLKNTYIVGIDSEWKPCFGTKHTDLALMQIATEDNVYILDITTMGNEAPELWSELALILFENKNILKLGFGIAQDMTVIRDSMPALSKIKTYGQGYLDIVHLWQKLVNDYKFVFPHESDQQFSKQNLSKLVELCLGQKLDKSNQFSNWEQRPLREDQITYAALDAYCLLEVYTVLETQCNRLDIPFVDICAEIQHIPHRSPKRNMRKTTHSPNVIESWRSNDNKQKNFHDNWSSGFKNARNPTCRNRQEHQNNQVDLRNRRYSNKTNFSPANLRKQYSVSRQMCKEIRNPKINTQRNEVLINNPVPAHKWQIGCDSTLDYTKKWNPEIETQRNKALITNPVPAHKWQIDCDSTLDYTKKRNPDIETQRNKALITNPVPAHKWQIDCDSTLDYTKKRNPEIETQRNKALITNPVPAHKWQIDCDSTLDYTKKRNPEIETQRNKALITNPVPAHKWRIVCDSTLGTLAAKLRMCGCDCAHLAFDQNGERSIKLAIDENRILITRNRDLKFSKYLLPKNHYLLINDHWKVQLMEVLMYFGISITKRDIFSRCYICNSNEFSKIPKSLMDKLIQSFVKLTRENNYHVLAQSVKSSAMNENNANLPDNCYTNNDTHCENRTWILNTDSVNINTCSTKYHARIQVDKVPINVLKNIQVFYTCEQCGQMYWNGSNLERELSRTIESILYK